MFALEHASRIFAAPHEFTRLLTAALALYWSVRGAWRWLQTVREFDRAAVAVGLSRGSVHRVALLVLLRATVLEPLNLGLLCAILALWLGSALYL